MQIMLCGTLQSSRMTLAPVALVWRKPQQPTLKLLGLHFEVVLNTWGTRGAPAMLEATASIENCVALGLMSS